MALFQQQLLPYFHESFPENDQDFEGIWQHLKDVFTEVKHMQPSLLAFYDAVGG